MQRRDPVVLAWVLGLGLAAVAYAVGPQYFMFRVVDSFHVAMWRISETIGDLSLMGRDLVRALAIGIYVTFVVLALGVIRRGGSGKASLFWVTVLFLFLIGGIDLTTESNTRWVLALAVAGVGAVTMTQRLRQTALIVR
jgi:hypothetical protein